MRCCPAQLWDWVNRRFPGSSRREMVHYRREASHFVKILLTHNEYRLESNILLLRQKINFSC